MALHYMTPMLILAAALVALPTALAKSCQTPFVPLNNQWCVHALITESGPEWPSAREECKKLGGDLMVVDTHEKMQALTAHIAAKYPGAASSYPYWVGGSNEAGQWQWVNGSPMSLASNLWYPGSPDGGPPDYKYTLLIFTSPWNRRYLGSVSPTDKAPAYVCEQ
ncbi:C-type lectin domain family 6 member A-like isoform X2 [Eriocheir sinensis]|uniref:C-type lectin domain family 6 member A-like isoform X2 n=1 Tax=Eriocheir sinensis TaxID=95602 RepID=UPI0021C75D34|nr:C-type lectin domain family 6 member A-like isoform X2 [Eriocheir sinensis]